MLTLQIHTLWAILESEHHALLPLRDMYIKKKFQELRNICSFKIAGFQIKKFGFDQKVCQTSIKKMPEIYSAIAKQNDLHELVFVLLLGQ